MSTDEARGHISKPDQGETDLTTSSPVSSAQEAQSPKEQQHKLSTPTKPIPQLHGPVDSDTASTEVPSPGTPPIPPHPVEEQKQPSGKGASSGGPTNFASDDVDSLKPRQVIAVSASRGPAAFFNLARKFLVTDEMCDLSALEGAIVSAVDAAHLLERSKLATIVRIQTSCVTVEPKRRKQGPGQGDTAAASGWIPSPETTAGAAFQQPHPIPARPRGPATSGGRELRRARIVITVKRTQSYELWLQENPLQAIIASDVDDDDDEAGSTDR